MLNKVRNYVQGQTFDKVKDYVRTHGEAKFPSLEEIELIVKRDPSLLPPPEGASDEDKKEHEDLIFKAVWWANSFLPQVAGASTWMRPAIRKTQCISEATDQGEQCVPPNSEAMAILFFENGATADPDATDKDGKPLDSKGKWWEYFKLSDGCKKKKVRVPRSREQDENGVYEGRYSSSKAGNSKFGGWSDAGLLQFNHYRQEIVEARKKGHVKQVEEYLLQRVREDAFNVGGDVNEDGAPKKKKKKKKEESNVDLDMGL